MRLYRLLLASVIVTTGCYGAVTGTQAQGDEGSSSAEKKTSSTPAAAKSNTNSAAKETPASTESQTTKCTADASACDQTGIATKIIVTLDGQPCETETSQPGNGLDMGLDGHGWTYAIMSDSCGGGFILNVSGLDDAAYPQTSGITFLQQSSIELFTNASDGSNADGMGGSFLSTADSDVAIESGPVDHVAKTIKGHATVQSEKGSGSHTVTFEMDF